MSLKYIDIKLAIIGDGEEKKKLEKLIIQLKLEDKIKLIESQENIYNYLSKSHFYISTSKWEGSSLAMIDAAYVGIPILCSDCPSGRKEFINNDERGYIFNSNDKNVQEEFQLFHYLLTYNHYCQYYYKIFEK